MSERRPTPNEFSSDDEPELEIVPMKVYPAAKPAAALKRRSSGLEEPIESGEIVERRSLVIRSSPSIETMPKIELRDDATEQVRVVQVPVAMPSAPRSKSLRFIWLAAAIVLAGGGVAMPFVMKPTVAAPNLDAVRATAKLLESTVDGDARAVQMRVNAIASDPVLRNGMMTNADTLGNMVQDKDLVFDVKPSEVLELFQLRDNTRTSVLRIPARAVAIDPPEVGNSRLEPLLNDGLAVIANAKVTTQSDVTGEIAMTVPIDLEPIKKKLHEQLEEGVLMGLTLPVVLVKGDGHRPAVTIPVETTTAPGGLSLVAVVRLETANKPFAAARYASFGLAGLFLVIFLVTLRRR